MSSPKLSISLVNTNSRKFLHACLKSLYEVDHGVEFETILVDNCSTDGSPEMVREEFPQVQLIVNDRRMGFAMNHNQAIKQCKADYILVLNEDTIIWPGALKAMCDYLDTHPKTGVVGCKLENPDGTLQISCYRFPTPMRSVCENLLLTAAFPNSALCGDYRNWKHDTVRDVDFVIGAALTVRREVLETTGLLDEGYFIYCEESDWCLRMHRDGWRVTFVPDGTIVHYGGQTSTTIKDRQFCEFYRNHIRYMRKNFGAGGAILHRSMMVFGAVLRLPLWGVARPLLPSKREKIDETLFTWKRILKWHLGFGPHEGIRELAAQFVKPPVPDDGNTPPPSPPATLPQRGRGAGDEGEASTLVGKS